MNLMWNLLRDQRIRSNRIERGSLVVIPEDTPGLPVGVSVELEKWQSAWTVTIKSSLHLQQEFKLPHSYSLDWTPHAIIGDRDFLKYLKRYS